MDTAKSDASPAPATTGRPLPDMKISTPRSICSSEDLFKPVLPGKGSLAKAPPVRADPIQYSRIATTLQKLYGGVILEDVHFLKECFEMLDGNDDSLLNRDELQRWIEMMSTPAPVDFGVPHTWQINWDEDMLDLLQRLGITDPGIYLPASLSAHGQSLVYEWPNWPSLGCRLNRFASHRRRMWHHVHPIVVGDARLLHSAGRRESPRHIHADGRP